MFPFDFLQERILRAAHDLEEKLRKEVMQNLLGRESDITDAIATTKAYYEGEVDQYHLIYKNIELGIVRWNYGAIEKPNYSIEFIPKN